MTPRNVSVREVVPRLVGLGLLGQLAVSAPLWLGGAWLCGGWLFPLPAVELAEGWAFVLCAALAVAAVACVGLGSRVATGALLVLLVLRCAPDRALWQSYVLEHAAMLAIALYSQGGATREAEAVRAVRWTLGLVFVWAGLHKLNPSFLADGLDPVIAGVPPWLVVLGEALLGAGLLVPRTQRVAAAGLAFVSLGIAVVLAVQGLDRVVIPWNVEHALLFVWLARAEPDVARRPTRLTGSVLVVFGVLPVLGLFGAPPSLALRLYTHSALAGTLYVPDGSRLPPAARSVSLPDDTGTFDRALDVEAWAHAESGALLPPDDATFDAALRAVCERIPGTLLVTQRPRDFFVTARTRYRRCADVQTRP